MGKGRRLIQSAPFLFIERWLAVSCYLIRVHPAAKELLIQPFDETFDSSNALRQLFHRRCI